MKRASFIKFEKLFQTHENNLKKTPPPPRKLRINLAPSNHSFHRRKLKFNFETRMVWLLDHRHGHCSTNPNFLAISLFRNKFLYK